MTNGCHPGAKRKDRPPRVHKAGIQCFFFITSMDAIEGDMDSRVNHAGMTIIRVRGNDE